MSLVQPECYNSSTQSTNACSNCNGMMSIPFEYNKDALIAITTLLSTNSPHDDDIVPMTPEFIFFSKDLLMQCPGLLLHSEKGDRNENHDHNHHYTNRKQAKDHAINLLNRPLTVPDSGTSCQRIARSARVLIQNVFTSFAMLIDSRLHAYTDLLTRHAIVLTSMDANLVQTKDTNAEDYEKYCVNSSMSNFDMEAKVSVINAKKFMIQLKCAQTEARALTTQVQIVDDNESTSVLHHDHNSYVTKTAIIYTFSMDLCIPETEGKIKIVPISFSTEGSMKCTFSKENDMLQNVSIDLDTTDLLENMVEQTNCAVSIVVDVANKACNQRKRSFARSNSYVTMPPPPPTIPIIHRNSMSKAIPLIANGVQYHSTDTTGLDLLCSAVSVVPIVSPYLSNATSPSNDITIDLSLEDCSSSNNDDDVSNLSIDQCADIVDVCLFGESLSTNHYSSPESSHPKRVKIEE